MRKYRGNWQKQEERELDAFVKAVVIEAFCLIAIAGLFGWEWLLIIIPTIAGLIALKLWKPEIDRNIIPLGMLAIVIIITAININEFINNLPTFFSTIFQPK